MKSLRCFRSAIAALLLLVGTDAHSAAPATAVSGTWQVPKRPLWAGEVFDLTLSWHVEWDVFQNLQGPMSWSAAPLVAEEWQKPVLTNPPTSGGKPWATISLQTRAMAVEPGQAVLQPAKQVMVLKTGTIAMGDYERAVTGAIPVESQNATLSVRPLPAPPPGFSGAVGHFHLVSTANLKQISVGDQVTWTLTLSGAGNWPQFPRLPARQVSQDFDLVGQPKTKELPGAKLFERSIQETVVLTARRAGRYVLGPVEMIQFDPELGQYERISATPLTLDVKPGAGGIEAQDNQQQAAKAEASGSALPPLLRGPSSALRPMDQRLWRAAFAIPPLLVCIIWLSLAYWRARMRDPEREARAAHARLGRTLALLTCAADDREGRQLVRSWQRDAKLRWKLERAAPLADSFHTVEGWSNLWDDAEIFLYGRSRQLPPDWIARAERLRVEMGDPPPFAPSTSFSRGNLFPVACAAAFFLSWAALATPAAAQVSSEKSWRTTVETQPLAWKARHNLALSLAAEQRWDEGAGQAAAAWIQHPFATETQMLWMLAARKAGYASPADGGIPQPVGLIGRAATLASPSVWCWIVAALISLCASAAVLILLTGYGHAPPHLRRFGLVCLGATAAGSVFAWEMVRAYGFMAQREAVIVLRATPLRPLPVETLPETVPQTAAAGLQARAEDRFLGWRLVRLRDGRSGWLRETDLVWVWGRPSEQAE